MESAKLETELYVPQPDEWFQATLTDNSHKEKFHILSLSTGASVYCPWQKISYSPGMHRQCLPVGTLFSVRLVLDKRGYYALEARVEDANSNFDSGRWYNELAKATITDWKVRTGCPARDCGCPIFVLCGRYGGGPNGFEFEVNPEDITVGSRVEINLRRSSKRGWVGFIWQVL